MDFTFATVDVKEELKSRLKAELPKFNYGAVKVLKADPQSASEMPCVGINRVDDSETNQSISDHHDAVYDPETGMRTEYRGTFFSEALEIRVWHTNADERDKLYQTTRAILFAHRLELTDKGLLNINLRMGKDEQDSSMTQAPMVLYWSVITMTYLNPLHVEVKELVEAVTSVDTSLIVQGGMTP